MEQAEQEVDVFLACNYVVIYVLCGALHCHAGKYQVRFLHEMTDYLLCMNPVKTSNNGCRLKQLRGCVNALTR